MAKLKGLAPRLGSLGPRVRSLPKRVDPFYVSEAWRKARAAKRALGPAFCCVCGAIGRLILDHRHERKDGGADLPPLDELDWYCTGCHNVKTAAARGRRARGETGGRAKVPKAGAP